jgi:hypothetical protein
MATTLPDGIIPGADALLDMPADALGSRERALPRRLPPGTPRYFLFTARAPWPSARRTAIVHDDMKPIIRSGLLLAYFAAIRNGRASA